MKSLLNQEFADARSALLEAAVAVDGMQLEEAERHLRTVRAICDVLIDLLKSMPPEVRKTEK